MSRLRPPTLSLTRKASNLVAKFFTPSQPATSHPDEPALSAFPSLPPEVWLQILAFLPPSSLSAITLVSHTLRSLALPEFLHTQLFFPFRDTFAFRWRSVSAELAGYEARSLARIELLLRDPGVLRELLVSPYPKGYNRRHRGEHKPIQRVLDALFAALPCFSNLTNLVLILVPPDDGFTDALGQLERVEYLELEIPTTARGRVPVSARRTFVVNRNTSLLGRFAVGALELSFRFPKQIQQVVAGPTASELVIAALAQSSFPALHTLDIALVSISSTHLVPALLATPNLLSFRLRRTLFDITFTTLNDFPAIPPSAVPHLRTYHGPAPFASAFAARGTRPLTTLRLWSSQSVSAADTRSPADLPPLLRQLGSVLPSVTQVEIGAVRVPDTLLATLLDPRTFPVLATLCINAHFDVFHPGSFERRVAGEPPDAPLVPLSLLASPAALKVLRLGAQLGSPAANPHGLCGAAREVLAGFPAKYDPTSWHVWVVDQPWCVVEWARINEHVTQTSAAGDRIPAPEKECDGNPDARLGISMLGTVRVEYSEHYFQGFERGARIAGEKVEEAMARMTASVG
ncbi:Ubiquitin family protein [Mycena chlorophos]|uniref:Ubiquitin family protein n=1 Tax=Mycena chlorophos TaxID=658473 RepID=A0A8H6TIB4_MYCCL|nr:Ubiquitin family protein [Mycena chlorophos]